MNTRDLKEEFIKEKGYSSFNVMVQNEWSHWLMSKLQSQSKEIKQLKKEVYGLKRWVKEYSEEKTELKKQLEERSEINFPTDEELKEYIQSLPYYGTCTTEWHEGIEDGVKWLKEQLLKD